MFLQSFMNFGGRLIIFQVLHVQWQRSARSVAVQGTFSGCPRNVQWLSKARSVAAHGTLHGTFHGTYKLEHGQFCRFSSNLCEISTSFPYFDMF